MNVAPDDVEDIFDEVTKQKNEIIDSFIKKEVGHSTAILICYEVIGSALLSLIQIDFHRGQELYEAIFGPKGIHTGFEDVIKQKMKELGKNDQQ